MDFKKIDWLNHIVAFGASVIGIFIAFQLDDWQDRRAKKELLAITLTGIKAEIEGNLEVYHKNASVLSQLLEFTDFYFAHAVKGNGVDGDIICTNREMELAKNRNPERLGRFKVLRKVNDSVCVYSGQLVIDVAPASGISTANWDAARSSGILTNLDHERVVQLSQVYEWTTKSLSSAEQEWQSNLVTLADFTDLDKQLQDYRLIMKASEFKHKVIRQQYEQIKW